jgi:hypothetical protein
LGLVLGLVCVEVGVGVCLGDSIEVRKCFGGVKVVWMFVWGIVLRLGSVWVVLRCFGLIFG